MPIILNGGTAAWTTIPPDEVYNGIHLLNGFDPRKGEVKKAAKIRSYFINRNFVLLQGRRILYKGVYSSHTRPKYKTKSDAAGEQKSIYEMTSANFSILFLPRNCLICQNQLFLGGSIRHTEGHAVIKPHAGIDKVSGLRSLQTCGHRERAFRGVVGGACL